MTKPLIIVGVVLSSMWISQMFFAFSLGRMDLTAIGLVGLIISTSIVIWLVRLTKK